MQKLESAVIQRPQQYIPDQFSGRRDLVSAMNSQRDSNLRNSNININMNVNVNNNILNNSMLQQQQYQLNQLQNQQQQIVNSQQYHINNLYTPNPNYLQLDENQSSNQNHLDSFQLNSSTINFRLSQFYMQPSPRKNSVGKFPRKKQKHGSTDFYSGNNMMAKTEFDEELQNSQQKLNVNTMNNIQNITNNKKDDNKEDKYKNIEKQIKKTKSEGGQGLIYKSIMKIKTNNNDFQINNRDKKESLNSKHNCARRQSKQKNNKNGKQDDFKSKLDKIKGLKSKIWKKNCVQKLFAFITLLFQLAPTMIGIGDEVLDIIYIFNSNFEYEEIFQIGLISLCLSPLIQIVIWTYFFSNPLINRDKYETVGARRQQIMAEEDSCLNYCKIICLYILQKNVIMLEICKQAIYQIPAALIYTILSEIKLLPFYIAFTCQTDYLVSADVLEEFIYKKKIFLKNKHISESNERIQRKNKKIRKENDLEMLKEQITRYENDPNQRYKAQLKKEKPQIKLIPIPESTPDIILKGGIEFTKNDILTKIRDDAILKNIMLIGDLMESVFEALPMLVIQYINNGINDKNGHQGWNLLTTLSFFTSLTMVFVFSVKLTQVTYSAKLFPAIEFYNEIKLQIKKRKFANLQIQKNVERSSSGSMKSPEKRRQSINFQQALGEQQSEAEVKKRDKLKSLNWVTNQQSSTLFVRDQQELEYLCQNSEFALQGWKKIVIDFENNSNAIKVSKGKVIYLIRLLILRLQEDTNLTLNFKYNDAITEKHKFKIYEDLKYSNIGGLKISHLINNQQEGLKIVQLFKEDLQGQKVINLKFDQCVQFETFGIPKMFQKHQNSLQELLIDKKLAINSDGDRKVFYTLFDSTQTPNLKKICLNLERSKIDENDAKEISTHLKNNLTIKKFSLNFSKNDLSGKGGRFLADGLKDNKNITHVDLDLSENNLGIEGGVQFGKLMTENSVILELDLKIGKNNLQEKGGKALAKGIFNNTSLTFLYLHLRENKLGNKTGRELGNSIEHNSTIKKLNLNLRWNDFGIDTGTAIGKGLQRNHTIKQLNINFWRATTEEICTQKMIQGFIMNKNIQIKNLSLLLRSLNLQAEAYQSIGVFFVKNKSVDRLSLNLDNNQVTEEVFTYFCDSLKKNSVIRHLSLNLERNNLTFKQGMELATILKEIKSLNYLSLNLQQNKIEYVEMDQIQQELEKNQHIETLHFELAKSENSSMALSEKPI